MVSYAQNLGKLTALLLLINCKFESLSIDDKTLPKISFFKEKSNRKNV